MEYFIDINHILFIHFSEDVHLDVFTSSYYK